MKITLCGSTRYREQFEDWNRKLSKAGHIVYSVASFGHYEGDMSPADKDMLDLVHLRKIVESDAIFVVGIPGQDDALRTTGSQSTPYIGESTRREIAWATLWGKPIYMLNDAHNLGYGRYVTAQPADNLGV